MFIVSLYHHRKHHHYYRVSSNSVKMQNYEGIFDNDADVHDTNLGMSRMWNQCSTPHVSPVKTAEVLFFTPAVVELFHPLSLSLSHLRITFWNFQFLSPVPSLSFVLSSKSAATIFNFWLLTETSRGELCSAAAQNTTQIEKFRKAHTVGLKIFPPRFDLLRGGGRVSYKYEQDLTSQKSAAKTNACSFASLERGKRESHGKLLFNFLFTEGQAK